MAGYIGTKAAVVTPGAERKKVFSITTTTTSLTGLAYTPGFVHVFHNGVRLVDGTDYTATNGTSLTLTTAAQNGDEVVVISYATFEVADAYTKAESDDRYVNVTGDTMTGQLDTPYQVIKGDNEFVGASIRNTRADTSISFIDAQNRTNAADSHIFFRHLTDGSSSISFGTQPAGDFTDRRVDSRMYIDGNGRVTMPYQPAFLPQVRAIIAALFLRGRRLRTSTSLYSTDNQTIIQARSVLPLLLREFISSTYKCSRPVPLTQVLDSL